jgi:SPP1 family predicted phage head-tail adaptor
MNAYITFQQSFDGNKTWVNVADVFAEIEIGRGRNYYSAAKLNSEVTGYIKIPYIDGITPAMRILFDNRVFQIISITNNGEHIQLEITVKEVI